MRIRDLTDLDVMDLAINGHTDALADRSTIVDALYAVMLPDLGKVTSHRFGKQLKAMPAAELRLIIVEAVNDFFDLPGPPRIELRGETDSPLPTAPELWRDVWRMAGSVGVDPQSLTFGELVTMVEGHRRDAWERTASLLAATLNSAFGSKGGAKPEDLDPTGGLAEHARRQSAGEELTSDNLGQFAAMMMGG